MTPPTKLTESELNEVRERVYRNGRGLVVEAANEAGAYTKAGTLTRKHPPSESGLEFLAERVNVPHALASALGGTRSGWAVYAYPVPVIMRDPLDARTNAMWTSEHVETIIDRARRWTSPVLVRLVGSRESASTYAHRDNTRTQELFPRLAEERVRFSSRKVGTDASGVFAAIEQDKAA